MAPLAGRDAAEALYAIGHTMLDEGRVAEAADVFRAMLLLFSADERAWLALGVVHDQMGQEAVAIELLSMGTLAVPRAVRTRIALARALRTAGRECEADSVLEVAEEAAMASDDPDLGVLIKQARRAA